ncbi:MFS transporter [Streptomyces sp. NPDC050392]|uniref:MFS transporter n=1 Tax=Streptomyces sp. NPDC050392 TaxID=3155782 RepID=UPI003425529A
MTAGGAAHVVDVQHRYAFALLGSVQTTLIFTLAAIAVPLPVIGREFGLQRADLILLSASYGLTFAGLLLFGGRLADRYGGRRTLAFGLLLFAAASAAAPFAPGVGALLAARFAQGAGAALVAPAAMAVLRAAHPSPAAYGRAMATWGGLSVLGATAGNLLSGVILTWLSWRWTFVVPLVVAVAALALAPRLLPPRFLLDRRRGLALTAIALSACATAMTSVVLSLHLQQTRDWSPLRTSAAFVPFALALITSGRAAGPLAVRYGAGAVTTAGLGTGAAGLALLAGPGLHAHTPYAYGLLPGLVLLAAGTAAAFGGAAVLATAGVPPHRTGLAGGVLNSAMELGPTVLFALLLALGSDSLSLAATGCALAVTAVLNHRTH